MSTSKWTTGSPANVDLGDQAVGIAVQHAREAIPYFMVSQERITCGDWWHVGCLHVRCRACRRLAPCAGAARRVRVCGRVPRREAARRARWRCERGEPPSALNAWSSRAASSGEGGFLPFHLAYVSDVVLDDLREPVPGHPPRPSNRASVHRRLSSSLAPRASRISSAALATWLTRAIGSAHGQAYQSS